MKDRIKHTELNKDDFISDNEFYNCLEQIPALAAQYAVEKEQKQRCSLTFGEAFDNYIKNRESVLTVSTIREYKRTKRVDLAEFDHVRLEDITQERIQEFINRKARDKSPKTVRNIHGLITAVLKTYLPSFAIHTTLPQKVPPTLYIPTDEDIRTLLEHIDDEDMMIAVLLAAFDPLRRSEICDLEDTDFNGNIAHIQRAVVLDENKQWVDKTTKSVAGNRYVPLPGFVMDRISGRTGRIIQFSLTRFPTALSTSWHVQNCPISVFMTCATTAPRSSTPSESRMPISCSAAAGDLIPYSNRFTGTPCLINQRK